MGEFDPRAELRRVTADIVLTEDWHVGSMRFARAGLVAWTKPSAHELANPGELT